MRRGKTHFDHPIDRIGERLIDNGPIAVRQIIRQLNGVIAGENRQCVDNRALLFSDTGSALRSRAPHTSRK